MSRVNRRPGMEMAMQAAVVRQLTCVFSTWPSTQGGLLEAALLLLLPAHSSKLTDNILTSIQPLLLPAEAPFHVAQPSFSAWYC